MDFLSNDATLSLWLVNYGSFTLFALLTLGIIALPVPEETLLVISGALMHSDRLPIPATIFAAIAGSMCGITVSYLIGQKAGHYIMRREGVWINAWKKHLMKAHKWFEHYGKWSLFIGYFIPGVRHFTGLVAGMSNLHFHSFSLYAYSGAIVWVSTFLSIGYFFGEYGLSFYDSLEIGDQKMIFIILGLGAIYSIYYFNKKN